MRWLAFTDPRRGEGAETYLLACSLSLGLLAFRFAFSEVSGLRGPVALAVGGGGLGSTTQLYAASAPDRALVALALGQRLDIFGRKVSDFTFVAAVSELAPPAVGPPPSGLHRPLGLRVGEQDCGGYTVAGSNGEGEVVLAEGQMCEVVQVSWR